MNDVSTKPMKIKGAWRDGYVLDHHIKRSDFLGYDGGGHPRFDTERTPIGELVYRLKYKGDEAVLGELVAVLADFIRRWRPPVDAIVPVPPSTARQRQPVLQICEGLSAVLGIEVRAVVTKRPSLKALKDVFDFAERLKVLEGAHDLPAGALRGKTVLLVDDLYRSGATLNAVTSVLSSRGEAAGVYVFCPTRTKAR